MVIPFYFSLCSPSLSLFKDFVYLFLERGEGREKGRETSMCGCLSCAPTWGPGPQPRHVPWLGIKPATLCFAVQCSIYWVTPARGLSIFSINALVPCPLKKAQIVGKTGVSILSCVTLGKFLNLSGPPFLIYKVGIIKATTTSLRELNAPTSAKHMVSYL